MKQTVGHFARHAEAELQRLHEQLREGTYRPQPVRRAWIPKPGSNDKRPLGIPAVRDRIVQAALRHVLEPIFETEFALPREIVCDDSLCAAPVSISRGEHSYGFRPGRGAKDALRRVDTLLKAGHDWVVDADLKSYFDTIPHERLLALMKQRVAGGRAVGDQIARQACLGEGQPNQARGTPRAQGQAGVHADSGGFAGHSARAEAQRNCLQPADHRKRSQAGCCTQSRRRQIIPMRHALLLVGGSARASGRGVGRPDAAATGLRATHRYPKIYSENRSFSRTDTHEPAYFTRRLDR